MNKRNYPSLLLEAAVNEFSKLPGIGNKTALRLVLYLLKQEPGNVQSFIHSLSQLAEEVKYCKFCNAISDQEVCSICNDSNRDHSIMCVVENIRDVMAIENTMQYRGVYHVLGGIISPMNGIGPSNLKIDMLETRVASGEIKEVIFALSTTMEGDTTNFYLYKKLGKFPVNISAIARGIAIGDELEYTDEVTLGRSILNRTIFDGSMIK
jgi:recombination protein RecR